MELDINRFESFFNEYQQRFIRFAYNYVHDESEAEDIVMDSMMSLWERREVLDDGTNLPAYVLTSVKNKCLNYLKSLPAISNHSLDDMEQWELDILTKSLENINPDQVYSSEIREIVERTLSGLSKQTRLAFDMSRLENKSNFEISKQMGISVKAVEYHITKALKALRLSLQDYLSLTTIIFLALK